MATIVLEAVFKAVFETVFKAVFEACLGATFEAVFVALLVPFGCMGANVGKTGATDNRHP